MHTAYNRALWLWSRASMYNEMDESANLLRVSRCWSRDAFHLQASRTSGDELAQWGGVPCEYAPSRILFMGINPGGSRNSEEQDEVDAHLLPAWKRDDNLKTQESWADAQTVYLKMIPRTRYWTDNCRPVVHAMGIDARSIALCNCMPFRTETTAWSRRTERASAAYVRDVLKALHPRCVVAMGEKAAKIMREAGREPDFTWNRGYKTAKNNLKRAATLQSLRIWRLRRNHPSP